MSQPAIRNASSHLNLNEKLLAIPLNDEGKPMISIANDIHVAEPVINKILQAQTVHDSHRKN